MGNSASLEYWNWPWAPADEVRCQRVVATNGGCIALKSQEADTRHA